MIAAGHEGLKPWDVSIATTRVGLERCMRAILLTRATLTDHFRMGNFPLGRGISAFLRVQIPEGEEDRFVELAKPEDFRPPPVVSI